MPRGRTVGVLLMTVGLVGLSSTSRVGAGPAPGGPCLPWQTRACTAAITTIGSHGIHARGPSLAIGLDGLPVISYGAPPATTDGGDFGSLRLTRCGDRACTTGNTTSTLQVFAGHNSGWHPSLAIGGNGRPVISSYEFYWSDLYVTACATASCGTQTTTSVDNPYADEAGRFSSIAVGIDGLPIIAHEMAPFGAKSVLRVTHCGNFTCTVAQTRTLWGGGQSGTDIAIGSDGRALIAHALFNGRPTVATCVDVACSIAYAAYLDVAGTVATSPSIAIGADGLPIVVYVVTGGQLRVTHCGDALCASGNTTATSVSASASASAEPSLAIGSDGLPVIAHYDSVMGNLLLTHCGDITCSTGNATVTVDGSGHDVGSYPSLAIGADGLPIVAYVNITMNTVKVAKCGSITCV